MKKTCKSCGSDVGATMTTLPDGREAPMCTKTCAVDRFRWKHVMGLLDAELIVAACAEATKRRSE
jgi:hypothetical protein